jgi:RHS repeat-associated protein
VQWNNWLGEQPWFKFEGSDLTDRMSIKVNVANGNLVVRNMDLAIKGTGLDLQIDRYYGSLSADTWHIGHGWNFNVGCDVRLDLDDWDGISYHEPDGYAVLFRSNGGGGYSLPAGFDADLIRNADGTYTVTWRTNGSKFNFQTGGCLQNIMDANGNNISMSYNGNLQSITDTQNRLTSFTYGSAVGPNLVTQIQDPAGRRLSYAYDASANLTSYADPSNQLAKYAYNANQQLSQITEPNGNVVNFSYGTTYPYPVYQIQYMSTSCPGGACTESFTYNAGNTVVSDANGNKTIYYLDTQGRPTSVADPLGNSPSLSYTANHNVQSYKDAAGATSNYTWDATNNLKSLQVPTGAGASLTYGDASHPYYPTVYKNAQGNTTSYTYDANGNVTLVTDALATQNQFKATYNINGTPASSTDPLGNLTSYSYDSVGNLTGITPPSPLGAVAIGYDGLSRRTTMTDGKGQKTTLAYDAVDRVVNFTYADNSTITYVYDANGNLTSMTDNTGTTSFAYDALNQVSKKTLPNGSTITYTYDPAGNLSSIADAGGMVTYAYNAVNLATTVTEPNGAKTTFAYDANYNRTSTAYPNGVTLTMTYDASGRLASIVAKNGAGSTLTSFAYSYNNPLTGLDSDLRSSLTDAVGNKTAYTYDALSRVTKAKTANSAGIVTADYQYTYDGNGNRLSQTVNGTLTTYSYNPADEMTSAGGTTYSYDANGNELGYTTGLTFAYNAKDQTASITPPGGLAINMTYTGALQSERTAAGGANFTYSALGLGIDGEPGGTTYYTRDPRGVLTEERTSTGNYYYLFDGLGSTVGLTDANGNVAATYQYDPYGQVIGSTGSVFNPWLFAATYYDSNTKLYKMGARYYDPAVGRFTQQDPVPSHGNLYSYVGDDPVNFTDPSGLFIPLVILAGVIIGAAIGGYLGHQWAHSHHYSTAGTIAMTAGGAVGGGIVGGVAAYMAAPVVEGIGARMSVGLGGRGLGWGGYRVAAHLAHKPFPATFRGGIGRTARWLWNHPDFRPHLHWVYRGVRRTL